MQKSFSAHSVAPAAAPCCGCPRTAQGPRQPWRQIRRPEPWGLPARSGHARRSPATQAGDTYDGERSPVAVGDAAELSDEDEEPFWTDAELAQMRKDSERQYAELKASLSETSIKFGGFLTGYLLLTNSADVAALAGAGAVAGCIYLRLLVADVDGLQGSDGRVAPFMQSQDSQLSLKSIRSPTKVLAALKALFRLRMLIPIGLAVAIFTYNSLSPEPLSLKQEGCIQGGFLSYKGALLLQIWEATKPRFEPEKLLMAARPSLPDVGDEADEAEWSKRINKG